MVMVTWRAVRGNRYFRKYWRVRRRSLVPSRDVAHGTGCFDLQAGPGRSSMLAERFGIPVNCPVKIYAAVVYVASDANCTPGVIRVQFGGGSGKGDVSVSRIKYPPNAA